MRVVLDTNVLVSAMLTPGSTCSDIVAQWDAGRFLVLVTGPVADEYDRVLHYANLNMPLEKIRSLLARIDAAAESVRPAEVEPDLPDPDDVIFFQCALGGAANCIVTGNKKHFPPKACHGMPILSPAEFLARLRKA